MRTVDEIREILEYVRKEFGRGVAVSIIKHYGNADRIVGIPEHLYDVVWDSAAILMKKWDKSDFVISRFERAADLLITHKQALARAMEVLMSAQDNLNTAIDSAVSEMGKAADFIRNHPASANDPALQAMADRLKAASDALAGVDAGQTDAGTGSTDTSGGASQP